MMMMMMMISIGQGKLYIITEYAGNGNLHDYIKKQKTKLPEDLIWKLFIQILMGLNHMHERKILHRDIKTLNVFLDDGLNVKLGDMGVAKVRSFEACIFSVQSRHELIHCMQCRS